MTQDNIKYADSKQFADMWADLNALYHTIGKLELRIWALVKWMRHSLTDQEYEVMRLRYAPHDKGGRQTLEEIGIRLHVTKVHVRQIETKALEKLGIEFYKTSIVYARGGRDDGHGVRAAMNSDKLKPLPNN